MKVFIDFDDVIFNTKRLRQDLEALFLEHGVDKELFVAHYNDPNDTRTIRSFNPWLQAKRIAKIKEIDLAALDNGIDASLRNLAQYVFDDVKYFVEKIGSKNIFIISFGDLTFQKIKINNSNVATLIPQVYITEQTKSEKIANLLNVQNFEEKLFFIDDRIEQIRDVKEKFPSITTILITRPEGRYRMEKEDCCNYQVHNLSEAEKIINT